MDSFIEHFWSLFLIAFVIWIFFGESLSNGFYAIIGQREKRRLSRKEEKALRRMAQEAQQTVVVATDIMRDVEAADRAFPQLPMDTRIRVDAFLAQHLQRPELPPQKKKPRQIND